MVGVTLALVAALAWWWAAAGTGQPFHNPLQRTNTALTGPAQHPDRSTAAGSPVPSRRVFGFLPFWNVTKTTLSPHLTDLGYFSLTLGPDGEFVRRGQDGGTDPGYRWFTSDRLQAVLREARRGSARLHLVVTLFDNQDLETFLASPSAQLSFYQNVTPLLQTESITGLNIDFEYVGQASPQLRAQLVSFVAGLRRHLDDRVSDYQLSLDLFPSAIERQLLWDVPALVPHLDQLIVMAYDFHRQSSPRAGPVAPLYGDDTAVDKNIYYYLQRYTDQVPAQQLVLGVPFYGYEWQTTQSQPDAATLPGSGALASYSRVQQLVTSASPDQGLVLGWSDDSLTPYLSYQFDGQTRVIHYDNARSLGYKLDLVNQLNLAGVAIWALGYEGTAPELWQVIDDKFQQ